MIIRIALLAALTIATGAMAQDHPGGETGRGQNMPDSRDARAVDQHMNHGAKAYHGHQVCKVYHTHGHTRRKCWQR